MRIVSSIYGAINGWSRPAKQATGQWRRAMRVSILLLASSIVSSTASADNILLLNAYHHGFPWTDTLVNVITEQLHKAGHPDIDVEYMDSKEIAYDEHYIRLLYEEYRHKFGNKPLDLVITTDDNALDFVRRFRGQLFGNVPIVFTGVNNLSLAEQLDYTRTVGVFEIDPVGNTIDLMLKLHPDTNRILAVFDTTPTGEARWERLSAILDRYPQIRFERFTGVGETLDTLEGRVRELPADTLVLFGSYYRDGSDSYISLETGVRRITTASSRPVYGMHAQVIQNGAIGGYIVSAHDQAATAAKMAIDILRGKPVSDIPVVKNFSGDPLFDHTQLQRFDIPRESLPLGSIILNEPSDLWGTYWQWVLLVILVVASLIAANAMLYVNISKRKAAQKQLNQFNERLRFVANIDSLTGLNNRYNFENFLAGLSGKEAFLTVMLDIDHFKRVNDYYNHKVGDRVLREIATRLLTHLGCDGKLYRLGGDEFGFVSFCDEAEVPILIGKIEKLINTPVPISETANMRITVSGGYIHSNHLDDFTMLQKRLDITLHEAKSHGRNTILAYTPQFTAKNDQLTCASIRMRKLVEQREPFTFAAQPLVNLHTRRTVGYELLLRLTFEDGTAIPPPLALQACEYAGVIKALSVETFRAAAQLLALVDEDRYVTINLSRSQLMIAGILADLIGVFDQEKQDLDRLFIEVTEDQYLEDAEFISILKQFEAHDIHIALDDFGSGYSSLTSLNKLPLRMAKLDKSFLRFEGYSQESLTYLRQLCSSLGLKILAEGIEDYADFDACLAAGVDLGQGYLLSAPLSFAEAANFPRYPDAILGRPEPDTLLMSVEI